MIETALRNPSTRPLLAILTVTLALAVAGCGNSSSSGAGGDSATAPAVGTTALLIGDNPPVDVDGFTVTIEKASLLGDGDPVVIFEGERTVDLLDHMDLEFLLGMDEVPAGTYEKVRLEIRDAEISPNPMGYPVFVPGNGKLDLNPQGEFTIAAGELTTIRIDFDVSRSVHVVLTGNQRFIVRPVAFVDIEGEGRDPIAISDLTGTVVLDDPAGDSVDVELDLGAGTITVEPAVDALVYDEDLLLVDFASIEEGDRVLLRGMFAGDGTLVASVVMLGDPLRMRGELPAGTADPTFDFEPDLGAPLSGTTITALATDARAWIEDGDEIDPTSLPAGSRARVTGRYFTTESLLRAALLDLETTEVEGTIVSVDLVTVPPRFVLEDDMAVQTEYAFDDTTEFPISGGGTVPPEFLRPGLGAMVQVAGLLDGLPRAWKVRLDPIEFSGEVVSVDTVTRIVELSPAPGDPNVLLDIRDDARILRIDGATETEIGLAEVMPGDTIEAFGLLDPVDDDPQIWLLIVTLD